MSDSAKKKKTGPSSKLVTGSAGWQKYVEKERKKEEALDFSEAELGVIQQVITKLNETNEGFKWHALGTEYHRMFVRGYWERKDVIGDIAESTVQTYGFREEYNVASMFKSRLPNHDMYHSSWPSYIAGEDSFGHWVSFERISQLKVSMIENLDKNDLFRYRTQHLEALMRIKEAISNKQQKRVCRYIFIMDLKGLSFSKHMTAKVRNLLQPLFAISGDRYPETLWTMFLVNTPMTFRFVWKIISPLVDPAVKTKIRILGGSKDYLPAMQATGLPLESIPKELGGKSDLMLMSDVIDALIDAPDNKPSVETFTSHSFFTEPVEKAPSDSKEVVTKESENDDEINDILKELRNDIPPTASEEKGMLVAEETEWANEDLAEEILFEGFLEKRGWYNTSWKRRYFMLKPSGLHYYSDKPSEEASLPQPARGCINLILVSKVIPVIETQRAQRGLSRAFSFKRPEKGGISGSHRFRLKINRKRRKNPVHGTFETFQFSRTENDEDEKDGLEQVEASDPSLPRVKQLQKTRTSISKASYSTDNEEVVVGFDVVTPYRTYNLRISEKDQGDFSEAEALVQHWVNAINQANEERMKEMERLMQDESEILKGFLERRGRGSGRKFIRKGFKKRYFVLTSQRLYYYTDINTNIGAVLKGKIELKKVQKCTMSKKSTKDVRLAESTEFDVNFAMRGSLTLRANDHEDALHWMGMINEAVTALKEKAMQEKKAKKNIKHTLRKKKAGKRQAKGYGFDEIVVDEDAEEELQGGENENENGDATSIQSMGSIYSLSSMGDNLLSMVSEALKIGKDFNLFQGDNSRSVPTAEELFEGAKSGVGALGSLLPKGMFSRLTVRSRRDNNKNESQNDFTSDV